MAGTGSTSTPDQRQTRTTWWSGSWMTPSLEPIWTNVNGRPARSAKTQATVNESAAPSAHHSAHGRCLLSQSTRAARRLNRASARCTLSSVELMSSALAVEVAKYPWYHTLDLGDGVVTD